MLGRVGLRAMWPLLSGRLLRTLMNICVLFSRCVVTSVGTCANLCFGWNWCRIEWLQCLPSRRMTPLQSVGIFSDRNSLRWCFLRVQKLCRYSAPSGFAWLRLCGG